MLGYVLRNDIDKISEYYNISSVLVNNSISTYCSMNKNNNNYNN